MPSLDLRFSCFYIMICILIVLPLCFYTLLWQRNDYAGAWYCDMQSGGNARAASTQCVADAPLSVSCSFTFYTLVLACFRLQYYSGQSASMVGSFCIPGTGCLR